MESHVTKNQSHGNSLARASAEEQKAEGFFTLYVLMGHTRSLEKLHAHVTAIGLRIALTSLKRYSIKYNWQVRLEEASGAVKAQLGDKRVEDVIAMNNRQAQLGTALQGLGYKGVQSLSARINEMSFGDAGGLIERGVKVERMAMGEATTRQEITHQTVSPIVYNIVTMFQQVNQYESAEQREREFAIGCDAILEQAVGPLDN